MSLLNQSSFINEAKIIVGNNSNIAPIAISNTGEFRNIACTSLLVFYRTELLPIFPAFSDSGTIIENSSGNSSINTNNGIIQNLNGGTFSVSGGDPAIITTGHIWTGCIDTLWENSRNWHTGTLPTEVDDVTIPFTINQPSVVRSMGMAKSIHVLPEASLYVGIPSALVITGFRDFGTFTTGFFNEGTSNNCGEMFVLPNTSSGGYGIYNKGIFNNADGNIQIDSSKVAAIYNDSDGDPQIHP